MTFDFAALVAVLNTIAETVDAPTIPTRPDPTTSLMVATRDGVRLATDIYAPECGHGPVVILRTPYGRGSPRVTAVAAALTALGFGFVAQDCRGTGASEPDQWDYYVHEGEDGYDLVSWVAAQTWCNGFIAACGSSYAAQVQWPMATHPAMGAIVPEVSGLGFARPTNRLHMFLNAYARSVGKDAEQLATGFEQLERDMIAETMATGWFCEPITTPLPAALLDALPKLRNLPLSEARRALWRNYARASGSSRAALLKLATGSERISIVEMESLPAIFGQSVAHDAHSLPALDETSLVQSLQAPALMVTGWYDWGLADTLATFAALKRHPDTPAARASRLIITPSAHNTPGYHEGASETPALRADYRTPQIAPLIAAWSHAVAADALEAWPQVVYYLLGANAWRAAEAWPLPEVQFEPLYLGAGGALDRNPSPANGAADDVDHYIYDPEDPTPSLGGSIVSAVYPPGSIDVAPLHMRGDMLVYTSDVLACDLDLVGPLRACLYASSSAVDTDFAVRLSDVHPDGRAIQIQNGLLRARFRGSLEEPTLMEPGRIYAFDIDLWGCAIRIKAGHRLRIDVSSADFPRFDRHANRVDQGPPLKAHQRIYRSAAHRSHILLPVLTESLADALP